jgi:hypothetical protein
LSDKRFKHVASATQIGMRFAREPAEGSIDVAPCIADAQAEDCRGSMDLTPRVMSGALGSIPGAGRFRLTAAMEKHVVILSAPSGRFQISWRSQEFDALLSECAGLNLLENALISWSNVSISA